MGGNRIISAINSSMLIDWSHCDGYKFIDHQCIAIEALVTNSED